MTVETEVATLTTAVDNLTTAVNVQKSTLDASVANALSHAGTASTHKTGAETAKSGAESARDQAYTYSQSAASAVTYQDLTAIAESKTGTAKDVFVYDTSKDSDGGAWRKRCQHTSWYNETLNTSTRGATKEFPAVAVIVAESTKVTIYDGDDPSMPMWATQASNTVVSSAKRVTAKNGLIGVATTAGYLATFNFVKGGTWELYDASGFDTWSGVLWGSIGSQINTDASIALVNGNVNDVAITVLPNAPIDSATNLPVPTIAVATDGGVSVIKDDGTVVSKSSNLSNYNHSMSYHIQFEGGDVLFTAWNNYAAHSVIRWDLNLTTMKSVFSKYESAPHQTGVNVRLPEYDSSYSTTGMVARDGGSTLVTNDGLFNIHEQEGQPLNSLINGITSDFNTGWMHGDIKLAALSDTDDTDVTGSELVTNGTFDGTGNISGWTIFGTNNNGVDCFDITTSSGSNMLMRQNVNLVIGKSYVLSYNITNNNSNAHNVFVNSVSLLDYQSTTGTRSGTFTATQVSNTIEFRSGSAANRLVGDNISLRLAEPDRSVNNNGLQIHGTIDKDPVATGADLVAYSGFTTSNYLEQPYNSDLNFGTGDFSVMGWVKVAANSDYETFLSRTADNLSAGFLIQKLNTNGFNFYVNGIACNSTSLANGSWQFLVGQRNGTTTSIYINGVLENSSTSSASVSGTNLTVTVGARFNASHAIIQPPSGSLALLRISATAPSAEQIAKIYEDEKPLFQENAQATLYGSSDAVTALAHDDSTNLLHVGTSAGRSVFQGLRRVDNTTDAVGSAISAANGLVAED